MTGIEWTDETWNPVVGCSKVSPGCAHCYAEEVHRTRLSGKGVYPVWRPWKPVNAEHNVRLAPERLDQPLRWTRPRMVFVNSMSDLFHERLTGFPDEATGRTYPALDGEPRRPSYIAKVFAVMSMATSHTFQVLTKRPRAMATLLSHPNFWLEVNAERMSRCVPVLKGGMSDYAAGRLSLPNVWLGTSIENRRFVERADWLRHTPAAVRFISAEPLLGPLVDEDPPQGLEFEGLDWIIVGGESGPEHRPMDPLWVRDIRDLCQHYGTAFFFKQWGGRTPKAGGRELDGRTWDEMPEPARV